MQHIGVIWAEYCEEVNITFQVTATTQALKVRRKCTIRKAEEEFVTWWCHLSPSILKKFTLQESEKGNQLVFWPSLVLREVSPPDLNLSHLHLLLLLNAHILHWIKPGQNTILQVFWTHTQFHGVVVPNFVLFSDTLKLLMKQGLEDQTTAPKTRWLYG
jgi:hypothetical protein